MRKLDRYDRLATKLVGAWAKRQRRIQGVKPLPREYWVGVWDDLHVALREQAEELEPALRYALDGMLDMRPYVDAYFADKWGHDEYIARVKAVLEKKGSEKKSDE